MAMGARAEGVSHAPVRLQVILRRDDGDPQLRTAFSKVKDAFAPGDDVTWSPTTLVSTPAVQVLTVTLSTNHHACPEAALALRIGPPGLGER